MTFFRQIWKMESLKDMFETMGYSGREAFLAYMDNQGHDTGKLYDDLQNAIATVYRDKEQKFIDLAEKQSISVEHLFEMVRFDFVLDSKLNVYLMEVNMSPNLSTYKNPKNKLLYQHTVYSMLNLVGVAGGIKDYITFG